jgi:hypothetical protein
MHLQPLLLNIQKNIADFTLDYFWREWSKRTEGVPQIYYIPRY